MVPLERSLAQQLENKPFALLGVIEDDNAETVGEVVKAAQITWPCWYEGESGGPIAHRYQMEFMPSYFLIDAKGIIRYVPDDFRKDTLQGVHRALTRAIDRLLEEAEHGSPGKTS
jgi:hypothetical protein